ncbi:MAG TPA: non-canonical purine NTP diphosphatase [Salinivirgaceae bacterium]|nr:non-canonical purine NTP diphosphatase [Salinivirgaceae bacterium]
MEIIFATHNQHKRKEIEAAVPKHIRILSLDDVGIFDEIPETGTTLTENAILKAKYVFEKTQKNCFADDTGLEVDALNGEPGVYSARYAGESKNAQENMKLLLKKLECTSNRSARFKTVIALIYNGNLFTFEGIVEGEIIASPLGDAGFGYDPIFVPKGFSQTFAQMPLELKNSISHRGKALKKLVDFLSTLPK